MTPRWSYPLVALLLCIASSARSEDQVSRGTSVPSEYCKVGIFGDGSSAFAVITQADDGFAYSFDDGRLGKIGSATSLVKCAEKSLVIDNQELWPEILIRRTDTQFTSGEITLAGRLLEPIDADEQTPLLIYAHGSERWGWIGHFRDPYHMVARGISVFVYDKRGTGLSQGRYTQNFPKLADDLVAASREAKRLAEGRFGKFGLGGLSQGGWIAPLAARRAEADFVAIGYGLVVDIREEDASQVQKELRDKGFGEDVLETAREITDITARIASSEYTYGIDELSEFQRKYSSEDWFRAISGGYTGVFLSIPADQLRREGVPQFRDLEIDWSLSPMTVLRAVDVPQLWILAGEDREAPIELTVERLKQLRREGSDIAIHIFPDTDHGMREFTRAPDGSLVFNEVTDGYYDLFADWVKGDLRGGYGTSFVVED
ncbi:MAG: alpha/beta hydrolase [Pseudomonadota bacterium]